MRKTIKTSTALIIVFAIAVLLGGGALAYFYIYQPEGIDLEENGNTVVKKNTATDTETIVTTAETVDWKTYTNSRVGYSFKYPESGLNLDLNETIKYPSSSSADAKDEDLVQFATKTNTYSVRTTVNVKETTIEDWIENIDSSKKDISNYSKTTIGGQTAYTFKEYLLTYVKSGNSIYQITNNKGIAPETNSDSIYQNWLSTFQFTSSDTTADWQTYTNSTYGFSFKYPKDYGLTDKLPKTVSVNGPSTGLELKKGSVSISFWPKPSGWGYEDYDVLQSEENIKVDTVSATERMLKRSSDNDLAISVLSTSDSNPFFFWATYESDSFKIEFDQILSTFQFTK